MFFFDSINAFNSLSVPQKKSLFPGSITKEEEKKKLIIKDAFYQAIPGLAFFLVVHLFYRFMEES